MSENIPPSNTKSNVVIKREVKRVISGKEPLPQQQPPLPSQAPQPPPPPQHRHHQQHQLQRQQQQSQPRPQPQPQPQQQPQQQQQQKKELPRRQNIFELTKEDEANGITVIEEKKEDKDKDEMANPYDLAGYEKISKIGEGTYGVVFKARQKESNKLVALKKIRLNLQEGVPTTTIREVAILKEVNHDNIIKLVDMIQRDETIYLVFDYFDVDLRRYMDKVKRPGLTAGHVKSFMHQLLRGLHYCHSHRILHRDLKPQNLLIDRNGRLSIADLGLSRAFGVPMRTYTHNVITLWYRAPEILLGSRHYSTAVDMWSVGCIMAEMISLVAILPGESQIDQLFRIFRLLGTPSEEVWPGVSTLPDYNENFPPWKGRDFKEMMMTKYPKSYLDVPDTAYDLLRSMLTYDPVSRISAVKAEEHPYFYDDITLLDL